jgi:hypothetical protein
MDRCIGQRRDAGQFSVNSGFSVMGLTFKYRKARVVA